MTRLDPIIAVKNVTESNQWYKKVFGFENRHTGHEHFAILYSEEGEIILCLHQWGMHEHPSLISPLPSSGNGLLLYFCTDKIDSIKHTIDAMQWPIEEEMHLNNNSLRREFSFRDPDGYFLTITEYHHYEG